jgi:S-adenosyl-L-methionine hydrolase (adenosine-forming)
MTLPTYLLAGAVPRRTAHVRSPFVTRFRYLSFLTDYGLEDGFVAACRGVAARIAPDTSLIDVTHVVPRGDVRRGAAVLAQTVPYLPPAVHVAVVDPGVGTARRGIAVAAGDSVFVGPDNGLLSWAVTASGGAERAFSLTNRELWLAKVSATFHGRDIFMPVAAHLAGGTELAATGAEIDVADLVTLPVPERLVRDSIAEGEVLTVDRFGNVQLTITAADAAEIGLEPGSAALIRCGRHQLIIPYRDMFGAVAPGELVAYADSAGLVSIAVNGGDAAQRLGLPPGARVSIAAAPQTIRLIRRCAFRLGRVRGTITEPAERRYRGPGPWILGPLQRRNLTKVPHRLPRGTLVPFTTGLAAVLTVLGVLGFSPAVAGASMRAGYGNTARDQEWWLDSLHVTQAWQKSEGSGITVAVLGTGVDASYPGLAGAVITGPDYTGSGEEAGSPYWGVEGTAVAGIIAAHEGGQGLAGVAPAAKILSVRVTLEFNDPLATDRALSQRLPDAIAQGIRYAADNGARIIDLPLDPGTLGLTGEGDPAAAGGSPAERAAIAYALSKGVVLVAPAGDDGQGPGIVNYPAAYPGVVAVGAIARNGQLASFSTRHSYPLLTAPGVSLVAATPPDGYRTMSSTSTASGIVAGVAALVLSRFPHLTAAQVTQALIESTATTAGGAGLPPLPPRSAAGAGYGTVDAIRAVDTAAIISAASQPRQAARPAAPHQPARHPVASPHQAAAGSLAGSVLRDAVAGVCVLIILLVVALLVLRSRRDGRGARGVSARKQRDRGGPADRARTRGQHENRRPGRVPASDAGAPQRPQAGRPSPPASPGWASPAGWQGGGIGEIRPPLSRPAAAPAPRTYRTNRGAPRADGDSGPPWAPAPEPQRLIGPLPVASASSLPPEPFPGIRLPGDMAAPSGAPADSPAPGGFDLTTPPADFDLSTPAFGLTPPAFGEPSPATEAPPPASDSAVTRAEALPARQGLGFAAAPVPADYAAPPAESVAPEPGPETAVAADPSYIWDLAATDVFPAATEAIVPQDDAPEAGES